MTNPVAQAMAACPFLKRRGWTAMRVAALALEALCFEAEMNDAVKNEAVTVSGRHRFVHVIQDGVVRHPRLLTDVWGAGP